MQAWVVDRPGPVDGDAHPLVRVDRPVPEPGPGQVRVRVRRLWRVPDGPAPRRRRPGPRRPQMTPGHEVVGVVDRLGPGSTRWREGDRIGVPWLAHTCGICRFCLSGRENLCLRPRFTGWDVDGGYADYARGGRGLRLRAPRRVRRRGGGAAPLRRDHRLPGPAAGQPARGRPARDLRVRRLGPSHGPGRAGPRAPASTS